MKEEEQDLISKLNQEYRRIYEKKPGTFLELMDPEAVDASITEKSVVIRFRTRRWMCNPLGTIHGGIVAAMADIAMAGVSRVSKDISRLGPTIQLDVNYLAACLPDTAVLVRAVCHKAGRKILFLTCTAYAEEAPEKILFTASGCFSAFQSDTSDTIISKQDRNRRMA